MSVNKFGKNRSVDSRYYNVPYKYLTSIDGRHVKPKSWKTMSFKEWKADNERLEKKWAEMLGDTYKNEHTEEELKSMYKEALKDDILYPTMYKPKELLKNRDKTLCIVDFFGKKKALVGWRNNERCTISMPKICPIVYKNGKGYIVYRGKEIEFTSKGGWVF